MNLDIPYGSTKIKVNIAHPCTVLYPNKVHAKDQQSIIEQALECPLGKESFAQFTSDSDRLLVIVNDATRPTPTAKIIDNLYPTLKKHPDVTYLVATGVHRAPTVDEYRFIFGKHYDVLKDKIFAHDARKDDQMTYLGTSQNGTEMYINKLVSEIGNVCCIGSVEPHYFAGYTGGRKSFLPGVASYKTIEMNHKLALSNDACSLSLDNNPVNMDMVDAMHVLKDINIFSIQTVLTGDHKIHAVTAGDLLTSFDAAITYANEIFCVPLKQKGNIVLTVAPYPMDIDLYQSQKALDNAKLAVEHGGIIILVSQCRDGVGESAFLDLLSRADSPEKVLKILDGEYKLGYHKAAKMSQIGTYAQIWAVTDLKDELIAKALMKPYHSIQDALDDAITMIKQKGDDPNIIVMPSGSLTVPLMKK